MRLLKAISLGIASLVLMPTGVLSDSRPISGVWDMGNNAGELVIRGTKWFHPKYGAGLIKRTDDAGDFAVVYTDHVAVRCSYRARLAADGDILVLTSANPAQSPDFCPSGRMLRLRK